MFLGTKEKMWGAEPDKAEIEDFYQCLVDIQMQDVNCKGLPFTWCNLRGTNTSILSKINRVLQNDGWVQDLLNTEWDTIDAGLPDHYPIVVTVNENATRGKRPFKFFEFWMHNDKFRIF